MSTSDLEASVENPKLRAEEIGARVLVLLEKLESLDDLSVDRIEDVTGITLTRVENAQHHAYSEPLDGGWYYSLVYVPASASGKNGLSLMFTKPHDRFADMTPICALDFEHYRGALKAMGFEESPIYGEIGQVDEWRYYRRDITLSLLPQNIVAGEPGRMCVKTISTLN